MNNFEKVKDCCINGQYRNKGDILNFISTDIGKNIVDGIEDYKVKPQFTMHFKKDEVSSYELFLLHLDEYIRYIKRSVWIGIEELMVFLELTLSSEYAKDFLYARISFHDNNSFKFEEYFWKVFCEVMLGNFKYMYNEFYIRDRFDSIGFNPNNYDLNNKDDLKVIFKFTCAFLNCNKDNTINLYRDLTDLRKEERNFMEVVWEDFMDNYLDKRDAYYKLYEYNNEENFLK